MGEAVVKIDDVLIHGYSSLVLATIITRIPRAYSLAASLHRQRRHAARLAFHLLLLAESRPYRSDGSVARRASRPSKPERIPIGYVFDFAPRLSQRSGPDHRRRPDACGADRGRARALPAGAHRIARAASRLIRDRARAGA